MKHGRISRVRTANLIILLCGLCGPAAAQHRLAEIQFEKTDLVKNESVRHQYLRSRFSTPPTGNRFDVTYYKLDLIVSTNPNRLRGAVTMRAWSTIPALASITLDLVNRMVVDSVKINALQLSFVQHPATLSISLDRNYTAGEFVELTVYYAGTPLSTGFGSFEFGSHENIPWVWSLSEPYGARDWWPCNDHPLDKADSVDIWVTCDAAFKVGSNGILKTVIDNGNGTKTHRWSHRYPIATYLVSIALTNFVEFTDWFVYSPTDSMPILNYVLPGQMPHVREQLRPTSDMLMIFSNLFGPYPFLKEKYGHASFGRGGAMEHQTMSSMTTFQEYVVAHELAHQWFGNLITCQTWPDLWMNEGFATYSEALYFEHRYGDTTYRADMRWKMANAKRSSGSIFRSDTSSVGTLFSRALVYDKGASVLHMLRHVLGDSLFFLSLKAYATDARFMFKTASTDDFRNICETRSGKNLSYFFDQWVYGEGFPHYIYQWESRAAGSGYSLHLSIVQKSKPSFPTIFNMPIDLRVKGIGWDTTLVLFNDAREQEFTFFLPRQPVTVDMDPDEWILSDKTNLSEVPPLPITAHLYQNYPNPFNAGTKIVFDLPHRSIVKLQIVDLLGRMVETLVDEQMEAGSHTVEWQPDESNLIASGVYIYRLEEKPVSGRNTAIHVRHMLLIR